MTNSIPVRLVNSNCILINFPGFIINSDLKFKFSIDGENILTFKHKATKLTASVQGEPAVLVTVQKLRRNGKIIYQYSGKIISKTYRFNVLCDYNSLAKDPIGAALVPENQYHPSKEQLPIIRPPFFTLSKWGYDYLYKENPAVKHGERVLHKFITISPEAAVPENNYKLGPNDQESTTVKELVAKLKKLFADRPVWTRLKLASVLNMDLKNLSLLKALPFVGYAFKSGPFRSCVIRFGFDPRHNYLNRVYQVISLRLPGMGPRIRNDIQICDVENPDSGLERLLTSLLFCKPDFDIKDGFFVEGHLTKIKEYLSAQTSKSQSTGIEVQEETEVIEDTIDEFEELDDFDLLFE